MRCKQQAYFLNLSTNFRIKQILPCRLKQPNHSNISRITFEKDSKVPNAGTFRINKEDHTLGNMLATCARTPPVIHSLATAS